MIKGPPRLEPTVRTPPDSCTEQHAALILALPALRHDLEVRGPVPFRQSTSRSLILASCPAPRLDRLLLLLDTGSSTSVRTTAAKQLAQLAAKSVISDVAIVEEDVKAPRQHVGVGDPSAWAELMAVVARVCLRT